MVPKTVARSRQIASGPSVLDPECDSRKVLERIADKWTALIIHVLEWHEAPRRIAVTDFRGIPEDAHPDAAQSRR
jgi:DNA-binding HxlR family transcriptional regulator